MPIDIRKKCRVEDLPELPVMKSHSTAGHQKNPAKDAATASYTTSLKQPQQNVQQ